MAAILRRHTIETRIPILENQIREARNHEKLNEMRYHQTESAEALIESLPQRWQDGGDTPRWTWHIDFDNWDGERALAAKRATSAWLNWLDASAERDSAELALIDAAATVARAEAAREQAEAALAQAARQIALTALYIAWVTALTELTSRALATGPPPPARDTANEQNAPRPAPAARVLATATR